MKCVCTIPDGGYCERHQVSKTPHRVKLCQNNPKYFRLWEQGKGPGQTHNLPPTVSTTKSATTVGVGTELKRILQLFKIGENTGCKCGQRATVMDEEGPDWCERNIETIIGWMHEEAKRRNLPFVAVGAKVLVKLAIRNARRKLSKLQ